MIHEEACRSDTREWLGMNRGQEKGKQRLNDQFDTRERRKHNDETIDK